MKQYRVSKFPIIRVKGYLYFIDKEGYPARVPMKNSKKEGPKMRVSQFRVKRKPGWLYFIDKKGYVARVMMKRRKK